MNGRLFLHVVFRKGKTIVDQSFFTPPFKLANISEGEVPHNLRLMLMSSSPGILDGDNYEIEIKVGESAHLTLETQSFQRLFQMRQGATQSLNVNLERGSSFCFLPQPSVPHQSSIYKAVNTINMVPESRLIYGEVITCGRLLNGEKFSFSRYENLTNIFFENRLLVKENIIMRSDGGDILAMGMLEGFTHQASLICIDERLALTSFFEELKSILSIQGDIEYGVSATQKNGFLLRILGRAAYQLHDILKMVAEKIKHPKPALLDHL